MAAEPDNTFVLALAVAQKEETIAAEARAKLAHATRYDDYMPALRKLMTRIAARYDITPPAEPPDYVAPYCKLLPDWRVDTIMTFAVLTEVGNRLEDFARDDAVDANVRLALAERLIGTKGSPVAAFIGAKLGKAAAVAPVDRDRWCRLGARAEAMEDSLGSLMFPTNGPVRALRAEFEQSLATHNALDALDTVADRLPAGDRPDPLDEEKIAACIASKPGDD
jgi:hypothetical protein